jgi:hypothetical protein
MSRWIWIAIAVAISTSVYFTIRYGLSPKPIPVINLTSFGNEEEIGAVVYRRLRQNILQERLLILGSNPDLTNPQEVWTGFLKTALADKIKIDVLFQRTNTHSIPQIGAIEIVPFDQTAAVSGKLVVDVKARLQRGHIVVVHATTIEASHLIKNSLSKQLDSVLRQPVLSIATMALAVGKEEEEGIQALCLDAGKDEHGHFRLNCAAMKAARKVKRKKPDPSKMWAVLERHGLKEFLLFVHRP